MGARPSFLPLFPHRVEDGFLGGTLIASRKTLEADLVALN